jgi:hypothetical protein
MKYAHLEAVLERAGCGLHEHCPRCLQRATHQISIHHALDCAHQGKFQTIPAILGFLSEYASRGKAITRTDPRDQTLVYGVEAILFGELCHKIGETRNLNKNAKRYGTEHLWFVPASSERIFRFRSGSLGAFRVETQLQYLCRAHAVLPTPRSEWFHRSPWMIRLFKEIAARFPPNQILAEVRENAPWLIDGIGGPKLPQYLRRGSSRASGRF